MSKKVLTNEQMSIILDNFTRHCPGCKRRMEPLSTRCVVCGIRTAFEKVFETAYIEHFEITKCDLHKSSFHFCSHPSSDCTIKELNQFCVKCIIQDKVKTDVQIITKPGPVSEHVSIE